MKNQHILIIVLLLLNIGLTAYQIMSKPKTDTYKGNPQV